jgi:hypothetical protein
MWSSHINLIFAYLGDRDQIAPFLRLSTAVLHEQWLF